MRPELSEVEAAARISHALARMPRRRCAILLAVRLQGASYAELAVRHRLTIAEVEREVAAGIRAVTDALDGPMRDCWWQRLLQWLRTGIVE